MNEEPPRKSSLNLTLIQHPRDEDFEPWEVHFHLEVEPPRTWYYQISPNSCTLVILLQVDPTFGFELEIICKGFYEAKDTSIFAWSSIFNIGHYRWLHDVICWLPPNIKVDYLIHTIQHILNFLQLWLSRWYSVGLNKQLQLPIELIHNLNKNFTYEIHVAIATLSHYLS